MKTRLFLFLGASLVGELQAAAPANDNFANATVITGIPPLSISGNLTDATGEPAEPSHDEDGDATTSIWFQWTAPVSGMMKAEALQKEGTTEWWMPLALYTGAAVNSLTPVPLLTSSSGGAVKFSFAAGTTYYLAIASSEGFGGPVELKMAAAVAHLSGIVIGREPEGAMVTLGIESNGPWMVAVQSSLDLKSWKPVMEVNCHAGTNEAVLGPFDEAARYFRVEVSEFP